jgi:hypothetical protein
MDVSLEINGFGGELVLCSIEPNVYEYWKEKSEQQLLDYLLDELPGSVPKEFDFAGDEDGFRKPWYELDDLAHVYGPDPREARISVDVDVGRGPKTVINNSSLQPAIAKMKSKMKTHRFNPESDSSSKGRVALQIYSCEKGCLFGGSFEIANKEDFGNLLFNVTTFEKESLLTDIFINGEVVDNEGLSTRGKGMFVNFCSF